VEARTIKYSAKYMIHVQRFLVIDRNDSIKFVRRKKRLLWSGTIVLIFCEITFNTEISNNRSTNLESVKLRLCEMVRDTRLFAVQISTSEFLFRHNLTGRSLNKWWAAKENCATSLNHNNLVRHSWNISSTSSAASHNNSNLWNTFT
jgi:hypothetical protein